MFDKNVQRLLPLDERFRQAEQYTLDLDAVPSQRTEPPVRPDMDWRCPNHPIFVSGCRYCDPN